MKKYNIQPADIYTIYSKTIITDEKIKLLTDLYQPLIGSSSISLYIFTSDGGNFLHNTLKARPWAWFGSWYGSWPSITTLVSSREVIESAWKIFLYGG